MYQLCHQVSHTFTQLHHNCTFTCLPLKIETYPTDTYIIMSACAKDIYIPHRLPYRTQMEDSRIIIGSFRLPFIAQMSNRYIIARHVIPRSHYLCHLSFMFACVDQCLEVYASLSDFCAILHFSTHLVSLSLLNKILTTCFFCVKPSFFIICGIKLPYGCVSASDTFTYVASRG